MESIYSIFKCSVNLTGVTCRMVSGSNWCKDSKVGCLMQCFVHHTMAMIPLFRGEGGYPAMISDFFRTTLPGYQNLIPHRDVFLRGIRHPHH